MCIRDRVDTDEFRSFLEFSHQMVEEGLMDVEAFSQTSEQYLSLIHIWKYNFKEKSPISASIHSCRVP